MAQNSKPSTEPLCFRLDRKNIERLDVMASKLGLTRATFLRFEALKIIEKNESVNV